MEPKSLLKYLICARFATYHSTEISEVYERYVNVVERSAHGAWSQFADEFELGNWLYELALLHDTDLLDLLETAYNRNFDEELRLNDDIAEVDRDLQISISGK